MKIDKVYIKDYNCLKDFHVDLDEKRLFTAIIGTNGTGKSSFIEALTIILSDLYNSREKSKFEYVLHFEHDKESYIFKGGPTGNKLFFKQNSEETSIQLKNTPKFQRVFAYYSGFKDKLEALFLREKRSYLSKVTKNSEYRIRPFFWIDEKKHSKIVSLCLAIDAFYNQNYVDFLSKDLGIEEFLEAKIEFKGPAFGDTQFAEQLEKQFYRIFDFLKDARRTPEVEVKEPHGYQLKKVEVKFKFNQANSKLFAIHDPKALFQILDVAFLRGALGKVDVKVRTKSGDMWMSDLSEGQLQLITILGFLKYSSTEDSLFLLDEPDTQLNPEWAQNFISFLVNSGIDVSKAQILFTSHNPLTLSNLLRDQVVIFNRDETGNIYSIHPSMDPKGLGVANILLSEFFKLKTTYDLDTYNKYSQYLLLIRKKEKSSEDNKRIRAISKDIANLLGPQFDVDSEVLAFKNAYGDFVKHNNTSDEKSKKFISDYVKSKYK